MLRVQPRHGDLHDQGADATAFVCYLIMYAISSRLVSGCSALEHPTRITPCKAPGEVAMQTVCIANANAIANTITNTNTNDNYKNIIISSHLS
jgi:hypothetical protein